MNSPALLINAQTRNKITGPDWLTSLEDQEHPEQLIRNIGLTKPRSKGALWSWIIPTRLEANTLRRNNWWDSLGVPALFSTAARERKFCNWFHLGNIIALLPILHIVSRWILIFLFRLKIINIKYVKHSLTCRSSFRREKWYEAKNS